MTPNRSCRAVTLAVPVFTGLLLLAGCQGPQRRTSPAAEAPPPVPETPPAPPATEPAAVEAPTSAPSLPPVLETGLAGPEQPAAPAVEPAPQPTRPTEAPPAEQEVPAYIRIVERVRPSEPAEVHVDASSPERLVIDTHNVRRILIDRERAPLLLNRSVVLRLDGQGIEWTADSRTRVFERSINGEWGAARERTP